MNMQQIMAQAQRMQKDIMNKKNEIDNMIFTGKSEWVEITMKGNRDLQNISILKDEAMNVDNKEVMCDMISIALKDVLSQIDKITESKLGSYGNMGGLI